jgi:hypothetical protein
VEIAFGTIVVAGCHAFPPGSAARTLRLDATFTPARVTLSDAALAGLGCANLLSLRGQLFSFYLNGPVPETSYYLTPVVNEEEYAALFVGPNPSRGDVQGVSDGHGMIELHCVPPGRYHLVVWAPYSWDPVVISPADQRLRVLSISPGSNPDLMTLYVAWP